MTPSADAIFQAALAAHRCGDLPNAERGYREVLQRVPGEPMALYLLGLVCHARGDTETALQHIQRSLQRSPGHVRAWKDLGGILMAAGRIEEARDAYAQALAHDPQRAQSWHNLGICLSHLGSAPEAIAHLQQALARDPRFTRSYEPLAVLLYRSGDLAGAAAVYGQWLRHEPGNPRARHMAAAAAGETPPRAPDDYVRGHFDEAADSFDRNLAQLRYRAPQLVADELSIAATGAVIGAWAGPPPDPSGPRSASPLATLLDAGCGTGLCGPLVRPLCTHLTGVDLSAAMLARAAARGCYDTLIEAELTAFLGRHQAAFDAVICVDTLVYFGDLADPLAAAHAALKPGGLLVFTLESGDTPGVRLQPHGRYTHGEAHVRQRVAGAGLAILALTPQVLREERDLPVAGLLVSARKL